MRESALQRSIIALGPTFEFARIEPKVFPFKGDVITRIINSHQIILDRMRESRAALGREGFDQVVHEQFISKVKVFLRFSTNLSIAHNSFPIVISLSNSNSKTS